MRPEEKGPSSRASHRIYDADEVDAYIRTLHVRLADLQAELRNTSNHAEPSYVPASLVGDSEVTLGQTLLLAQRNADDIVLIAKREAEVVLELASSDADECLAAARAEALRLLTEARRAIETFLRDWDDELCDQISEARRNMFGGFGRHSGPRRMVAGGRTVAKASAEVVAIGQAADTRA